MGIYLFTEHGLVAALHSSLVEGCGDDRLAQGGEEQQEAVGHGVWATGEVPASTNVQNVSYLLHLNLATALLKQPLLSQWMETQVWLSIFGMYIACIIKYIDTLYIAS